MTRIHKGDTFTTNEGGSIVVLDYVSATRILVKHNDAYGHEVYTRAEHIKSGAVKNPYRRSVHGVGFVGVGEHSPRECGKLTTAYRKWTGMLERGYCQKLHNVRPTYIGCSVHEDWHNFQTFAEWFYKQNCPSSYHLDKDILIRGNKIYSESTCCLVPAEVNTFLNDQRMCRGDLPQGVSKRNSKYQAKLRIGCRDKYLGVYATPEEAFEFYKKEKENVIKDIAKRYINEISSEVYSSLMKYEVVK